MGIKLVALATLGAILWTATPSLQDQKNYIDKYQGLAIKEMERSGVPASITMAQALLESNSGKSDLARRGKNHFGIKCGGRWNGPAIYKEDDDYRNGRLVKSCFRSYRTVEHSYRDHSDFLRNNQRYDFLFDLNRTNYKGWARGLKKAGYATSRYYHRKLIELIEQHRLYELDKKTSRQVPYEEEPAIAGGIVQGGSLFLTINDVKYVLAHEGETLDEVSDRVRYSTRRLLRYNEGIPDASTRLDEGDLVFIQPKRRQWRGRQRYHTVTGSETMHDISQKYGISVKRLYRRNKMIRGEEPAVGEQIKIRGGKVGFPPDLRTTGPADPLPEEEPMEGLLPPVDPLPERDSSATRLPAVTGPLPEEGTEPGPTQPGTDESGHVFHVVQRGETLWSISRKYQTTVDAIRRLNGMVDNTLSSGARIRVK